VSTDAAQYQPPTGAVMDARLEAADRPGEHLWIMTAGWVLREPPETARDPDISKYLDRENLVILAGPGCYKCELPWSPTVARRRCGGHL
jgi:hypothetical protein